MINSFLDAGLDRSEAEELIESGFIAIDTRELDKEKRYYVNRSEPANVFSPSMRLGKLFPAGSGFESQFVLIDTHTGSVMAPFHLRSAAVFGQEGFRQPTLEGVRYVGSARTRFRAVPYLAADSLAEYHSITAAFQQQDDRIFFRGQTRDYNIHRTARVRSFLYGDEGVRETSLPSAAFRSGFSYVESEPIIEALFGDIDYRLRGAQSKIYWVEDKIEMVYVSNGGIAARSTARTMALAQHYGIPTNGLDVTRSSRFAWWFASHLFNPKTGKYTEYLPSDGASGFDRPVVYVLRSNHAVDLEDLKLIATRPLAQAGAFLHGSWGLHGNVCAEDLIAIIRLGPGVGICDEPLEKLFPVPQNDPMYRELLKLKASLTGEPFRSVLGHVYEVH